MLELRGDDVQTKLQIAAPEAKVRAHDFVPALEGLRGLAALFVLLFHIWLLGNEGFNERRLTSLQTLDELLLRLVFAVFNGHVAVTLFFVLSGYVLVLSLHRDIRPLAERAQAFVGRRFFRIYPALFINVLLTAGCLWLFATFLPGKFQTITPRDLAMNLLLADFLVNGATWTMLVEFLAVPLLLLGHWIALRYGPRGLMALLIITIASGQIYKLIVGNPGTLGTSSTLMLYFYQYVVTYQFMFVLGMLVAELQRRHLIDMSQRIATMGLVVSLSAMFGARFLLGYIGWAVLIEGLGCAGLIAVLVSNQQLKVHRFLEWRPVKFLGVVSYSFYLYHATAIYFTIGLAWWLLPPGLQPQSIIRGLILALICLAITIPMAWASFVLIEKPWMKLGQRL